MREDSSPEGTVVRLRGSQRTAESDVDAEAALVGLVKQRRVLPQAPFGSMAERTVVPSAQCLPVPDGLDDVTAAAIANPGMSSWVAYTERAKLRAGETVLVNGATGTAGRLAVQIAKHLGAKKVIATGRNREAPGSIEELGADATIPLVESAAEMEAGLKAHFAEGVDIVIDYLWGKSAECLLIAGAKAGPAAMPIRFVQIAAVSSPEITLPGAVLRSSPIQLMGSGIGSVPLDRLVKAINGLLQATIPGGFKIATKAVPLSEVERARPEDDSKRRAVFTLDDRASV
jgi:NADPH:quinone reductase-like Zn-dependent oxidoreductase